MDYLSTGQLLRRLQEEDQPPPPPNGEGPPGGPGMKGGGPPPWEDGWGPKPPPPTTDAAILKSFAFLPKMSGSLSLLGSSFIIYDVLFTQKLFQIQQQQQQRPNNFNRRRSSVTFGNDGSTRTSSSNNLTYYRLLLGMSTFDAMASIAYFMSTWPIPEETPFSYNNVGTIATCTAQGFFVQLGLVGAILYSGSLSTYYLLTIKYGWKQSQITSSKIEYWFHGIPIVFTIATSVAGLVMEIFNPTPIGCWINKDPPFCAESWQPDQYGPPCKRGDNATLYKWTFSLIPQILSIGLVTINMFLCYRYVLNLEKVTARFRNPENYRFSVGTSSPTPTTATNSTTTFRHHGTTVRKGSTTSITTMAKRSSTMSTTTMGDPSASAGIDGDNIYPSTLTATAINLQATTNGERQQDDDIGEEEDGVNTPDGLVQDPISSSSPPIVPPEGTGANTTTRDDDDNPSSRPRRSRSRSRSLTRRSSSLFLRRREDSSERITRASYEQSRKLAVQCYLYVGALYLTLIPEFMMRIAYLSTGTRPDWILIIISILKPLQGFWNSLIYIRPRYLAWRLKQSKQKKERPPPTTNADEEENEDINRRNNNTKDEEKDEHRGHTCSDGNSNSDANNQH